MGDARCMAVGCTKQVSGIGSYCQQHRLQGGYGPPKRHSGKKRSGKKRSGKKAGKKRSGKKAGKKRS